MKVAVRVHFFCFIFLWICLLTGAERRNAMTVYTSAFGREQILDSVSKDGFSSRVMGLNET